MDIFLSEDKRIQRHTRRLTNRDAQPEDRETSARWLLDNGSDTAIMGLLSRFDVNLDHQFKDKAEKDLLYSLIASLGDKAVVPAQAWLRRCKQFANPLRLLEDLQGREAAVDAVLNMLELELAKDDFKPEKKASLLVWLTDVRDERCHAAAEPFLDDFDEGVRYSAAEVMIAQGDDYPRGPLLRLIANPDEESNRVKVRVAEVFAQRRWAVDVDGLDELLPPGFTVKNGRIIKD